MMSKRNIFLVGSTGFIGKVSLGMLLERDDVGKVYVFIRPKEARRKYSYQEDNKSKNSQSNKKSNNSKSSINHSYNNMFIHSAKDRFETLKNDPCFASNACQTAFEENRVIPVSGNLSAKNLGLSKQDYDRMTGTLDTRSNTNHSKDEAAVHFIINLAANVSFDQSLSEALVNNVDSSLNITKFAKCCKSLINFVHCSTAYVTPGVSNSQSRDVNGVKEDLYDLPPMLAEEYGTAESIYTLIQKGILKAEEDNILKKAGHTNTYTFTKWLTEIMISEKCQSSRISLTIVRPSIVSVSLRYPVPGWVDNTNTFQGPLYLYGAGFLHTRSGLPQSQYDVVPCDYVANRLINAAFNTKDLDLSKAKVIHATAGKKHSIKQPSIWDIAEEFWHHNNRKSVMLRPFLRPKSIKSKEGTEKDQLRLQRIRLLLLMAGKKKHANKMKKIIPLLSKVDIVFQHFHLYTYDFKSSAYSIKDFDPNFNEKDYFHLLLQGIHYYLLKRGEISIENPKPKYALTYHNVYSLGDKVEKDSFVDNLIVDQILHTESSNLSARTTPVVVGENTTDKQNWMKTISINCVTFVEPTTVDEITLIVKDVNKYPSPCRPCGSILSPSSLSENEGGTTISTAKMNTIYGLKEVLVPGGRETASSSESIKCIDCEPGVTLRELQKYAHEHNLELPFSAEIGDSTISGTCFAVTKDSSIGKPPVDGMMIGDVASMLWSVHIVEEDGVVREYSLFKEDEQGTFDPAFIRLLDSYGSTGIAVRMLVATRPQTALTTKAIFSRFNWRSADDVHSRSDEILNLWKTLEETDGNLFCIISLKSKSIAVEKRSIGKVSCSPLSCIVESIYRRTKKAIIQHGAILPQAFNLVGKSIPSFTQKSRSPGNHYNMDIPLQKKKLSFSYYGFPIDKFQEVFVEALRFTKVFEQENEFTPRGFAIYFVKLNGHRLAGPYSFQNTSHQFSFDPVTDNPNDPKWQAFCAAFNSFAESNGARCSLNQTLALENNRDFARSALSVIPSERFASPWLNQFSR